MEIKKPTAAEVTQEIIDAWKAKHGDVFMFESNDKQKVGFFRRPTRTETSAFNSLLQKGKVIESNESMAKTTFLGGDEELITVDKYFYGLSNKLGKLLEIEEGELSPL